MVDRMEGPMADEMRKADEPKHRRRGRALLAAVAGMAVVGFGQSGCLTCSGVCLVDAGLDCAGADRGNPACPDAGLRDGG
jgi:hypothetical protein